mmetsp:Transcript_33666/g.24690  ORF Transcript_33666/g.24690 Transcript_33666/m.24690 type:complete len:128 (+) Transcript_33666:397-780(+)
MIIPIVFLTGVGIYIGLKGIKTWLLFASFFYLSLGLMFLYEVVFYEDRTIIKVYEKDDEMLGLVPSLTKTQFILSLLDEYLNFFLAVLYLVVGVLFYYMRHVSIMKQIGNLRSQLNQKVQVERIVSI